MLHIARNPRISPYQSRDAESHLSQRPCLLHHVNSCYNKPHTLYIALYYRFPPSKKYRMDYFVIARIKVATDMSMLVMVNHMPVEVEK